MLSAGDRVLVGVSGGADSLTLLKLLTGPLLFVPRPEFVLAVYVDMGFEGPNGHPADQLERYFEEQGYRHLIKKTNIGPLAHSDYNRKAAPVFSARGFAAGTSSNWPGNTDVTRSLWPTIRTM